MPVGVTGLLKRHDAALPSRSRAAPAPFDQREPEQVAGPLDRVAAIDVPHGVACHEVDNVTRCQFVHIRHADPLPAHRNPVVPCRRQKRPHESDPSRTVPRSSSVNMASPRHRATGAWLRVQPVFQRFRRAEAELSGSGDPNGLARRRIAAVALRAVF